MKNWLQRIWAYLFKKKKAVLAPGQKQAWYDLQEQNRVVTSALRGAGKSGAEFKRLFDAAERRPNKDRDGYGFREAKPLNLDNDAGVTIDYYGPSYPDQESSREFDGLFGGGGYSGAGSGGSWDDNNSSSNDYGSSSDSSSDYSSSDSGSTNWD